MTGERHAFYRAMVSPASIAIVGASDNEAKPTSRPLRFLDAAGWTGRVHPVNPSRERVGGRRAYVSIRELPETPDHVFVLTGDDLAVEAVEECARRGVPIVTVLADGFIGDSAEAAARRSRLAAAVGPGRTRLLGTGCLGLVSPRTGLVLTANAAFREPARDAGGVFLASQSGSVMGGIYTRGLDSGIGFHTLLSTGAELDLSLGEICLASVDDPSITSYALFMENLSHVDALADFARAAAERGKPVLVYKLGRSRAAAQLTQSHTGALASDDVIADAVFADLGLARVTNLQALIESHELAARSRPAVDGARPRVAVVSTTGGGGAMAVDCLAMAGAQPSPPSAATRAALAEAGISAGDAALVDLTLAGTRYDVMKGALEILGNAPEYDLVVAVPGSSARFQPELVVQPIVDSVAGVAHPIAAFVVPSAPEAMRLLRRGGVSAFGSPEALADGVLAVASRRAPRPAVAPARAHAPASTRLLSESDSYRVLGRLGVPVAEHAVVPTASLPERLPVEGPVAVKIHAEDLAHKSDIGGVVLGVDDVDALRGAVDRIVAAVSRGGGTPTGEILVQRMARGVAEALIGYRVDPDVGPIVLLAAGGVAAELHGDRSVRLAPVDLGVARQMIAEVKAFRLIEGYRGLPRGDVDALAEAVVAVSRAGRLDERLVEVEVNPLFIGGPDEGVWAVDAVVRLERPGSGGSPS